MQTLWEDQHSEKPKYAIDTVETTLEAMQRQLKLEQDDAKKTPESALQVINNHQQKISAELDSVNYKKIHDDKAKEEKNSLPAKLERARMKLEGKKIHTARQRLDGCSELENRVDHLTEQNRMLLTAIGQSKDQSLRSIFGEMIAKTSVRD